MRHFFYCDTVGGVGSAGLLLLRLVVGAAFLFHGWSKIQSPLGWMGPEATMPAILQALAAISEFGGGPGWFSLDALLFRKPVEAKPQGAG
jgi:hypothetical protein